MLLHQIEFRLSENCDRLGDSSRKAHIGCDLSHQRRSKYLGNNLREHLVSEFQKHVNLITVILPPKRKNQNQARGSAVLISDLVTSNLYDP